MKQFLARFTSAVMVLAALALTLGAGIRWFAIVDPSSWIHP